MKNILIIDDDPVIRKYLGSLLNDNGYETAFAENAEEAMGHLAKDSFDLITLDLDMPGEWGTRFFSRLAKDNTKKIYR